MYTVPAQPAYIAATSAGACLWEIECLLYILHLLACHAVGLRPHVACAHIDVGGLAEDICLVERVHDVSADSYCAVLLPEHHVVQLYLLECGVGQLYRAWHGVWHDAYAERGEGECLRYHGPQDACHLVVFQETAYV